MGQPITRKSLTQALEQAVAERGADWVYPTERPYKTTPGDPCRYFTLSEGGRPGKPACIFGAALTILGYGPDESPNGPVGIREYSGIAMQIIRLDPEGGGKDHILTHAAGQAQLRQDTGATWGETLARFKEVLEGEGE